MAYLISVVVPTKNRYKYLKYLIKLIDSFKLPELEFVIQDNSDNNEEIIEFLSTYHNPNIKYFHCTDKLTMSQNGELAINHAEGEYVCYIGDDDGVCRNIVDCVKWMKERGIDAAYNNNVWFTWGMKAKLQKRSSIVIHHNTKEELESLVSKGCNLLETRMPLIYHGIVRKTVLEGIAEHYGTLFPSVPPDISGSICLASAITDCYELGIPVIINGTSQMTGGGVINKGGVVDLKDVSFITQKDIEEWEGIIPPIWSGGYAWANSGLKTLRIVGFNDLINSFDLDYCLARTTSVRPQKKVLWKMGFDYSKSKKRYSFLCVYGIIHRCFNKLWENRPGAVSVQREVQTIIEAEDFFNNYNARFGE